MKWSKEFEVGHEKIDLEHRVFFNLLHSIAEAHEKGLPRDKIRRLITEAEKYAEFHFLSEENIMIDVGYPEYEEHHKHHEELLRKLRFYIIDFESGETDIQGLVKFLHNWFIQHTTTEDLGISRYIANTTT